MSTCVCSLAGTKACETCQNGPMAGMTRMEFPNSPPLGNPYEGLLASMNTQVAELQKQLAAAQAERDEARNSMHKLFQRGEDDDSEIVGLKTIIEKYRKALEVAERELKWGHSEMRGRPPEHWLDALDVVSKALAPAEPVKGCGDGCGHPLKEEK